MTLTISSKRRKTPKINVAEFPYVDIMPQSRRDAIDRDVAAAQWKRILAWTAIIAVVVSLGSVGFRFYTQLLNDSANSKLSAVETKIDSYASVDEALTIENGINANITTATANSIGWIDLLSRIQSGIPSGASPGNLNVITGGTKAVSVAVSVDISSTKPITYAEVKGSLENIKGILPESILIGDMDSSTTDSGRVYTYSVAFSVDDSLLLHAADDENSTKESGE